MEKPIVITLHMNKEQSRLIRRLLNNEERRLRKEQDDEPNEYLSARLELQISELRTIENSIFLDELESEANQL